MPFDSSKLWKRVFEHEYDEPEKGHIKTLVDCLVSMRKQATVLTGEISADLREYTVHDVTHLDALWDVADQIIDETFIINPLEAFILGGAFLFHDAAMTCAAYNNGIEEIYESLDFKKILQKFPDESDENIRKAVKIFLRQQHAVKAGELPFLEFQGPNGSIHLIENHELRGKFGKFIGDIASSHWWGHEEIEKNLNKEVPAPPPFPAEWKIDLIKVASLLRTSDACHIDSRRAPSFLFALRAPYISNYSKMHWNFQNKLCQPERRDDAIIIASTSDFSKNESSDWWELFDYLGMVNRELQKTDSMLHRLRGNDARLAAKRIHSLDNLSGLTNFITVAGWKPIDTTYTIEDVPKIISKLGGEELYGKNPYVPIREIIQNGMDAVRVRRIVDKEFHDGLVSVRLETNGKSKIIFSDNGVGLSQDSMVDKLLSFGQSGWAQDSSIGEYTDEILSQNDVSGKFGIGFFSIFMLGNEVKVKTVRFDEGANQTSVLEFKNGLNERPILFSATGKDRLSTGGTTIEVFLTDDVSQKLMTPQSVLREAKFDEIVSASFPTSDVKLKIEGPEVDLLLDGSEWKTEQAEVLLKRLAGQEIFDELLKPYAKNLRPISNDNGDLIGRMLIAPDGEISFYRNGRRSPGVIVTNGARIGSMYLVGAVEGYVTKASRDGGLPAWTNERLSNWATEQCNLLQKQKLSPKQQIDLASTIYGCGGKIGELKICRIQNGYLSLPELEEMLNDTNEVFLLYDHEIYGPEIYSEKFTFSDGVIIVDSGYPRIVESSDYVNPQNSLDQLIRDTIVKALEISADAYEMITSQMNFPYGKKEYGKKIVFGVNETGRKFEHVVTPLKRGMTIRELKKHMQNNDDE